MKNATIKTNIKQRATRKNLPQILTFVLMLFFTRNLSFAQIGSWQVVGSNAWTQTNDDVAIGTALPNGKTEIYLGCTPINGLVVTKDEDCVQPYTQPIYGGNAEVMQTYDDPNTMPAETFSLPFNYKVGSTLPMSLASGKYSSSIPNNPLIWARTKGALAGGSLFSNTRFVVMPDGKTGINVYNPRATIDVRNMDNGYNYPAAIFGVNEKTTGTGPTGNVQYQTRHIQIVPKCSENSYNQITKVKDLGIFFTDGLGMDGANLAGALVLAPWAASANPLIGGIRIDATGKVEIHGNLRATKINVDAVWWSDFVFKPDHKLMSIGDLEAFIKTNGHLPDMPSEKEVFENGIDLAIMQALQQQKIEELTLYIIELQKQLNQLQIQVTSSK